MSGDITVLNSIDQLAITESLAKIVVKLPAETEEMIPDKIKDLLSFRDFTSILNGFGLKVPRNRTKLEMISSILTFAGDFWPEIHRIAENVLSSVNKRTTTKEQDHTQSKEASKRQNVIDVRTPFDPRLASVISEMYMSPRSNWREITDTIPTKEAKKLEHVFGEIIPETIPNTSISDRRDSLIMQLLAGQTRSTSFALNKFGVNYQNLNEFSGKVPLQN